MLFKKKINGIIGFLKLEDFWLKCTKIEQNDLMRYYQMGIGTGGKTSLIEGNITTTQTRLGYFTDVIGWASKEQKYEYIDKIVEYANGLNEYNKYPIDSHFFFQEVAESYYKQRAIREDAINLVINYCEKDIELFNIYKSLMIKEYGSIPRLVTFQRLVIVYEKTNQIEKAIKICNLAIDNGLIDSTKSGFEGRLEKLKKKL